MSCPVCRAPRTAPNAPLGGVATLLALAACSSAEVDKPQAPDMEALVATYESPDADFDLSDAPELVVALAAANALLERTSLRAELVDVLAEVIAQADDISDEEDDPLRLIDADGYMQVTRICAGYESPSVPDLEQNGALLVTATFSDSALDPVAWGDAAACRYLADEAEVELNPLRGSADAVRVHWGDSVELGDLSERALLVDLGLIASIDGERVPLDFDFRSLADGGIEYRLPLGARSLIAQVSADERVSVRARNGTFDCGVDLECSPRSVSGEP